jgi:autotransporter-associated beta strand protein
LGAFNQSIAGLTFGTTPAATIVGTVTGGTGVLTLNGAVNSSGNVTHVFNGNASLGGALRDFNVGDGANAIDLQAGAAFSNGTLNKLGAGTMALTGTSSATITINAGTLAFNGTSTGPVTASAGTLSGTGTVNALTTISGGAAFTPGTAGTAGTFTTNALTLAAGAMLNLNVGTGNDLINVTGVNGLTTAASTALKIVSIGGPLSVGTTDLITHSGPIQGSGLGGFQLSGVGHATATLQDTGSVLRLNVTQATGTILWTGATNNTWDTTAANLNWRFQTGGAPTSYLDGDDVRFADLPVPAPTTVNIAAAVTPSRVTIDNTAANPYTFTGANITGPMSLTKSGAGTVVFQNVLGYSGATTISAGTLEMDFDTGNFFEAGTAVGTSGISVATGATLRLTRDDADFTFERSVSGAGTVLVDPHTAAGTASRTVTISGNNSGFSGTWKLSPSNLGAAGLGSFRTLNTTTNQTSLGTAAIDVDPGGQLWMADNTTLTNNITITGTGFAETAGGTPVGLGALTNGVYLGTGTPPLAYAGIGAIRMGTGDTLSGNITVDGNSKIMAFGQTGTLSGIISSTSPTDTLVIGGGTSATTIILTGTNTYGKTFVNGGSGTSTVIQSLQVGNGGSTGTLGSGEVVLYGDSAATGRLVFQRGDAYTLAAGQNVTGAASATGNLVRTSVVVNNTGAGLTLNNNNIDLADGTNGGNFSVAGTGNTIGVTGAVVNILGSSLVDSGQFFVGDATNASGTVNQGGTSTVNFLSQMRIGHWPTETGAYNISGGTLNALGAPTQFPFQTAGTQETNGGIYLGIDGAGVMVQSGGVINTNFIVLDNRADTGAGNGMTTGFDTFTQNGGKVVLNNAFGIISRNFTTAINLNGGTIQAGTGISPALDTNKIVVQSGGVTLDTNGANTFTLYGPLAGTGTVSLTNTGAGTGILRLSDGTATATAAGGTMPGGSLGTASINLPANTSLQATRTTGVDAWSGNIAGTGSLVKQGAGIVILTGSGAGFTGTTTVSGGRLDLPATFASPTITVADGAALGGEPTVASVTLGSAVGAGLFINPETTASLTATNLTLNGTTTVDFSAPAASTAAAIPVIRYTTLTGAPTFALANAANYRSAAFANAAGTVSLTLGTKDLTWTGTSGAAWDVNTTTNFNDTTSAPEKFFFGDRVVFGDGPTQTAVTVTSGVSPWKTTVNSSTNNYTFTSTTNGIAGPGNLEKSGASTLTLVGPNTYSGKTIVSGGTLASATLAASLGNASPTNTIELSGGARLSDTGAAAFDFGVNRSITIGTGGASISHNNATAAAVTISGNLISAGANTLSFHSAAAGAGTFILTGDNSGFTGNITVDAQAAGLTVLRISRQAAGACWGIDHIELSRGGREWERDDT